MDYDVRHLFSGRWGILAWCRLLEKQAQPRRLIYKREI
jgi:hypothetical protein